MTLTHDFESAAWRYKLGDFLLARIAEDEADAQDALDRGFGGWEWLADAGINYEARTHIVRWHPARVLAECEAKRRIVEWVVVTQRAAGAPPGFDPDPDDADALTHVLRLLALPYADHPDYREEWRPEVIHEERNGVCIGCEHFGEPVEWLLAEARGHSDEQDRP